jgi:hypothetical protein
MNDRRVLRRFAVALAAAPLAVAFSAPTLAASDVSQTRAVSGFDQITLNGAFKTKIVVGPSPHVVVSGDPDVLASVKTNVSGHTLVVEMKRAWVSLSAPRLTISLPALRSFTDEGAGTTNITGLSGGNLKLQISGAGSIVAAGRADSETITLDGAGKIDATAVDAGDVTVDNNGLGWVHVRAHGRLKMTVNGVGEIRYAGNPSNVQSEINGVGRISHL